jgi:cysteine desulfuration protein SufE
VEMDAGNVCNRLDEIVAEFADLEPRERLELLLDFADGLPALPREYQASRDAGENRVHECQTPVYLWVKVKNGRVEVYADVAEDAPTVRGFVGVLIEAFFGADPGEVVAVKSNLLARLGLMEALGMVRMRGLTAVLNRIRSEVALAQHNGDSS